MATFETFPNEVLIQILQYLPLRDKLRAEMVCKQWKDAIRSLNQRTMLLRIGESHFRSYKVVEKYKCDDKEHQTLDTNCATVKCTLDAVKAIRRFNKIKTLAIELNHLSNLADILPTIGHSCSDLEHIEFKCNEGVLTDQLMQSLLEVINEKVKHFILINQYRHFFEHSFGNESARRLFQRCPNLEMLVLDEKTWVDIDGLSYLPLTVTHLFIPWVPFTEEILNSLSFQMHAMQSLEIGFVTDQILQLVCEFENLTTFLLRNVKIDSPKSLLLLCKLKYLKSLQIHFADYKINIDEVLLQVLNYCSQLRRFCIYGANITDKCVSMMSQLCPQLEVIELDFGRRKISDESIYSLFNLKTLRILTIPFTAVTDEAICDLLMHCKQLEYIDVSGCTQITKQTFDTIVMKAEKYPHKVFTLGILNPMIYELMEKPPNLRLLHVDKFNFLNR
ncbi:F-box/LRR-repeat protein 2-like protein [Dinothrombium tinctorium]|uniref:F-box/LRR-repeat protein 2-like protein n=1 Tax=Dinothrombium tinctorium TaxID=1965070 RepID=A0A3S3PA04_9ACAR|nr:F-box/LRR-repeat protein 2-like protein [Dinothrombium tinctorium]